MNIVIHTDGGARGNPGPAAVGVVVEGVSGAEKKELAAFGKTIGETTNNVAEYTAVIEALMFLRDHRAITENVQGRKVRVEFFLDSMLVVNQLNGLFKVKDAHLRELLAQVRVLEQEVGGEIVYHVVPREQNRRADFLVNAALDSEPFKVNRG